MENKGSLVVISGFSGVGKGTVIHELVKHYGYRLSVSATTRGPREGEEDGREYFFLSLEEFQGLIRENGLIEYARYVDHYYGTPARYVEEGLAEGQVVLLEIEVQGALLIRERYPDAILIFITAPSAADLRERLMERGTEDAGVIEKRMLRAREEAESMSHYQYIVCNERGKVEECAEMIRHIIEAESCRIERRQAVVSSIREGLQQKSCIRPDSCRQSVSGVESFI